MSEKQSFLDRLNAALLERGISETDIAPYMEQFDRFFDRMVSDGQAGESAIDNIDAIADNIAAQVSDRYDEINRLAERTMTVQAVQDEDISSIGEEIYAGQTADGADISDDTGEAELVEIPSDMELVPVAVTEGGESDGEAYTKLPDYVEPEKIQDTKMFWILFAASLPITIPLALIVLGIFGLMWGAVFAVIGGSVALLVALVTSGCALSLVGIIYGITQLFVSVPVGLYEIGIGIVIAGIVMFVGILVYNFAIRLVPKLIKLVYKLFLYVLGKLRELFNYLRRESARL